MQITTPKVLALFFLLAFGSFPLKAEEQKPIEIYTYLLKDRLSATGNLPYNKILNHLFADLQAEVRLIPAPIRRSQRNFKNNRHSCVFPTATEALKLVHTADLGHKNFVQSAPFDYVSIRLFTLNTLPKITNLDQLKDKTVGHLLGSIGKRMLKGVETTINSVSDEEKMVRLLNHNRIDVLMGHHPDTPMAIDRLGSAPVHYDPNITIYRTSTHIVCHDFKGGADLLARINPRIEELRHSGKLQDWLGPHAEIVQP